MLTTSIFVVDRDPVWCDRFAHQLRHAGHLVSTQDSTRNVLDTLAANRSDLLLLDWSGIEAEHVLREIKASDRYLPVRVIVTDDGLDAHAAVDALHCGADDFFAKTNSIEELVARVTLALKRQCVRGSDVNLTRAGRICIDHAARRVTVDGEYVELAPREFHLLHFFAGNVDRLYSRAQLLSFVWQRPEGLGERTVDVHVRRLRRILEPFGCDDYVETVRGAGYRFGPPQSNPTKRRSRTLAIAQPQHA